jgi:exodeoxyribonuclease VII small subunit
MEKKTFESSMKQLEAIVRELENGDLPLEEAVSKFEEGILVSRRCSQLLNETEKRITLLLQSEDGTTTEKRIEPDDL